MELGIVGQCVDVRAIRCFDGQLFWSIYYRAYFATGSEFHDLCMRLSFSAGTLSYGQGLECASIQAPPHDCTNLSPSPCDVLGMNISRFSFIHVFPGACSSGLTISTPQLTGIFIPYAFTTIQVNIVGALHANNTFSVLLNVYDQVNYATVLNGKYAVI